MPVLITGATGLVGRALASRLLDEGAQVRAYIRRDDHELRAAGVHIAVGEICDVPRLESALTRVHTIVHLVGGLFPPRGGSYDALVRESTECAVIAARAAEVRRFVYLSTPGADPGSDNAFLAARGAAEAHITSSGLEHAILRCAPILEGMERIAARFRVGPVIAAPGTGGQRIAAIALADVVDALVAADARDATLKGTWDLGGEPVPLRDLLAPFGRVVFARRLSAAPKEAVAYLGSDVVADPGPARAALGLG